jgi:N5-(cytidine 5'-diphosphoramidyl)-L-glutamine hydrolase
MKIVALSQRVDFLPQRDEVRDAIDQRLINFILECGGLSMPVPNTFSKLGYLSKWLRIVKPDAIILSGGADIGSCSNRDHTDYALLDFAEKDKLPVLGICRGMQLMGVRGGVDLKPVDKHINVRHSLIGRVVGQVNSYHALSLSELPEDYHKLACSEDGEIEAISHKSLPWEGWMWHPEREKIFSAQDIKRLTGLLK